MKKKQILIAVSLGLTACWLGIAMAGDINHGGSPADGSGMRDRHGSRLAGESPVHGPWEEGTCRRRQGCPKKPPTAPQ